MTHAVCPWADSCTCAADTADIQETERKYLEKNPQCHGLTEKSETCESFHPPPLIQGRKQEHKYKRKT